MSRIGTESELLAFLEDGLARADRATVAMRCALNSLQDVAEDLRVAIEEDGQQYETPTYGSERAQLDCMTAGVRNRA